MGLLNLFVASSISVLKVLLITALGSYLALDHVDVLGKDARKHINAVIFYVFNPALVSTKLASTITLDSMMKIWFMPVSILITFIFGSAFGWMVIKLTRPPNHLRGLIIGCCAAGNLGNMFLVMIPAVCKEKGSPFGTPDVCQSYGFAYISVSMAVGAIYFWGYVYNIVRASAAGSIVESEALDVDKNSKDSATPELESCTEPLLASNEPNADECALTITKTDGDVEMRTASKWTQQLTKVLEGVKWKHIFAPSTIGAIVGFTIGLVSFIRKLMVGDEAPLRVIQDSFSSIGDGAIPTVTLIIGGNLLRGLRGSGVKKSWLFGIILARYVALPLTGILIVKGAIHLGFVPADPLYQFILLLQFAVPPAMNIGTITQLFGAGEAECSVIMLWTYGLASISLTFWSTFFMWLVS